LALFDQALHAGAAQLRQLRREKAVEPLPFGAGIGFRGEPLKGKCLLRLRHEVVRMAVASEPDNTPLPGTVFTPRQVRVLKFAVIVMGILLVGGFAFVLAAIVYQASRGGQSSVAPGGEPVATELQIPKDASVSTLSLDGDRLALQLQSSAGGEIVVIDLKTGKVLTRVKLKAE
jgi:hypothetical protein